MTEEKDREENKLMGSRGIYLLPNIFTTAALFGGFYAVVAAMKGLFDLAAIAIFVAMCADALDGRIARMTNTQTAFGAQYDSLSDLVAFGVAPALLTYSWSLVHLGKFGWLAAFLFTAATALRLARFNTQVHDEDKKHFQGLPCPAAAGVVTAFVWLCSSYGISGLFIAFPTGALIVVMGALMVSSIRYYSFKQIDLKGRVPFIFPVLLVLMVTAVAIDPPQVLFSILFLYALSGPLLTLIEMRRIRRIKKNRKKL